MKVCRNKANIGHALFAQMFSYSSGNKWKSRRKMLTPAFHFKMLQEFVSVFDTESKVLLTFFVREFSKKYSLCWFLNHHQNFSCGLCRK